MNSSGIDATRSEFGALARGVAAAGTLKAAEGQSTRIVKVRNGVTTCDRRIPIVVELGPCTAMKTKFDLASSCTIYVK